MAVYEVDVDRITVDHGTVRVEAGSETEAGEKALEADIDFEDPTRSEEVVGWRLVPAHELAVEAAGLPDDAVV